MVTLKEIIESLKKLLNNKDKLNYLNGLLDKIDDKKLKEGIKGLIEDIKELDAVAQIETKGRVEWSVPEDEPVEERRLERQIISIPLPKEEKKEDKAIEYGLQSNVDFYRGRSDEPGIKYQSMNRRLDDEGKSFIDRSDSLIERRVNEQFTGKSKSFDDDQMSHDVMNRYQSSQESRGYSSLSDELHEKNRKKPKF